MTSAAKSGVTVAICAHNAAGRLSTTLNHLTRQIATGIEWEVLVVDNGSTDDTSTIARRCWPAGSLAPLRVVHEPQLGVANARQRAIREAHYEYVSFVDDDNWVSPNWVALVFETLKQNPTVAAVGSLGTAASDGPLPDWFEQFQENYAVGPCAPSGGDMTWSRGSFFTAGLALRREAALALFDAGFRFQLSGRKGGSLSSGEDSELCFALRLSGWHLWYEPRLRFVHFLPQRRLQWNYLRALWRGFGEADPVLDAYRYAPWAPLTVRAALGQTWWWRALHALRQAFWTHGILRWGKTRPERLQDEVLSVFNLSRFRQLLHMRTDYDALIKAIRAASWVSNSD